MGVKFNCAMCQTDFYIKSQDTYGACNACTCDCPHCGGLLLVDGKETKDFHKSLNEKNPEWPKDGKGTYSVGLEDEEK